MPKVNFTPTNPFAALMSLLARRERRLAQGSAKEFDLAQPGYAPALRRLV